MLPTYRDIDSVPRVAPGVEPRQRPAAQEVKPLAEKTEDACYHRFHMARVTAELVRPCVAGPKWGGFDLEMMQVAFLARAIQTRLPYVHFLVVPKRAVSCVHKHKRAFMSINTRL